MQLNQLIWPGNPGTGRISACALPAKYELLEIFRLLLNIKPNILPISLQMKYHYQRCGPSNVQYRAPSASNKHRVKNNDKKAGK